MTRVCVPSWLWPALYDFVNLDLFLKARMLYNRSHDVKR